MINQCTITLWREISLPRSGHWAEEVKPEQLFTPEQLERLNRVRLPAYVEKARKECVYEFLEQAFLPLVRTGEEVTKEKLVNLALGFKEGFSRQHQLLYLSGGVDLLLQSSIVLSSVADSLGEKSKPSYSDRELAKLVERASTTLDTLMDEHTKELISI